MNIYYEILGINPEASQSEIKKAYFKMIRKHSPESDPEQFQKIREAYEQLKNEQNAPERPIFPPLEDSEAEKMLELIKMHNKRKDAKSCMNTCEEAWRLFPQYTQFLYLLVIAQRQCGKNGKAVKNAETLVCLEPENKWFQRELAISYAERGFTKKAYGAFEKAYELGCRDIRFVLMYSMECDNFGKFDKGIQILLEFIRRDKRYSKDELQELINLFVGLFKMSRYSEKEYFVEIIEELCRILEQYKPYMTEYIQIFAKIISHTGINISEVYEFQKAGQALDMLRKMCCDDLEREAVDSAREEFDFYRIMHDNRISQTLKIAYVAYHYSEPSVQKFALTDIQLCMIEERSEVLEQEEIIRSDYPEYYEKLRIFIQKLKSEKNLIYLKESLQKIYRRMEQDFDGGHYYKKYPNEKKRAQGTLINEGAEEETFVRDSKKISRNELCPCGSGKKYKHCCMNKQN